MIGKTSLKKRARSKLKDADILLDNKRYDGAIYLCGYVIELILKARTCRTLNWTGFPETNNEFRNFQSFRTHNLDVLLSLSGLEEKIKLHHFFDWNLVNQWNPEMRYADVGIVTATEARAMINAVKNLIIIIK